MKISTYIQTTEQRDTATLETILSNRLTLLQEQQATSQAALKAKYAERFPKVKV